MERLTRKLERRRCSLADLCQLYRAQQQAASHRRCAAGARGASRRALAGQVTGYHHQSHGRVAAAAGHPEVCQTCDGLAPACFLHPCQASLRHLGFLAWQAAMLPCAFQAVAMCTTVRPPGKAFRAAERHDPCRFAAALSEYHDADHLTKFEELLEAAVDLDRIPDEYLICSTYDAGLQARPCPSSCASCHSRLRLDQLSNIVP